MIRALRCFPRTASLPISIMNRADSQLSCVVHDTGVALQPILLRDELREHGEAARYVGAAGVDSLPIRALDFVIVG